MTHFNTALTGYISTQNWSEWDVEDTSSQQRAVFEVYGPKGVRTTRLDAASWFTHRFFDGHGTIDDFTFVLAGLSFIETTYADEDRYEIDFDRARRSGGKVA